MSSQLTPMPPIVRTSISESFSSVRTTMSTSESGRRKSARCCRIVVSTPLHDATSRPSAFFVVVIDCVRVGLDEEAVPALELRLDAAAEGLRADDEVLKSVVELRRDVVAVTPVDGGASIDPAGAHARKSPSAADGRSVGIRRRVGAVDEVRLVVVVLGDRGEAAVSAPLARVVEVGLVAARS